MYSEERSPLVPLAATRPPPPDAMGNLQPTPNDDGNSVREIAGGLSLFLLVFLAPHLRLGGGAPIVVQQQTDVLTVPVTVITFSAGRASDPAWDAESFRKPLECTLQRNGMQLRLVNEPGEEYSAATRMKVWGHKR